MQGSGNPAKELEVALEEKEKIEKKFNEAMEKIKKYEV